MHFLKKSGIKIIEQSIINEVKKIKRGPDPGRSLTLFVEYMLLGRFMLL